MKTSSVCASLSSFFFSFPCFLFVFFWFLICFPFIILFHLLFLPLWFLITFPLSLYVSPINLFMFVRLSVQQLRSIFILCNIVILFVVPKMYFTYCVFVMKFSRLLFDRRVDFPYHLLFLFRYFRYALLSISLHSHVRHQGNTNTLTVPINTHTCTKHLMKEAPALN